MPELGNITFFYSSRLMQADNFLPNPFYSSTKIILLELYRWINWFHFEGQQKKTNQKRKVSFQWWKSSGRGWHVLNPKIANEGERIKSAMSQKRLRFHMLFLLFLLKLTIMSCLLVKDEISFICHRPRSCWFLMQWKCRFSYPAMF